MQPALPGHRCQLKNGICPCCAELLAQHVLTAAKCSPIIDMLRCAGLQAQDALAAALLHGAPGHTGSARRRRLPDAAQRHAC